MCEGVASGRSIALEAGAKNKEAGGKQEIFCEAIPGDWFLMTERGGKELSDTE